MPERDDDPAIIGVVADLMDRVDSRHVVSVAGVQVSSAGDVAPFLDLEERDEERVADALELLAAQIRSRRQRPPSFALPPTGNATGSAPGFFSRAPMKAFVGEPWLS